MGDWTYYPNCRLDSQGAPLSPFRDGTPVGTSDHGAAWGRSLLDPSGLETPYLMLPYTTKSEGYVLDDIGLLLDDIGGIFNDAPWPGGVITSIDIPIPNTYTPTGGTWDYDFYMRRRSDGTTILFQSGSPVVPGPFGVGPYTTNLFTGLPWVATDILGTTAAYDFYITNTGFSSGPVDGTHFVRFCFLAILFTPLSGSVISVNPSRGSVNGGQTVVITGTGLTGATVVEFGGVAVTFTPTSDTRGTATTPAHASGLVDVEVIGVGTLTDAYAFVVTGSFLLPPLPTRTPMTQGGGRTSKGLRRG